ncbi:MAG: hypothetical protein K2Q21_05710 [Chitinophagaceae bacterium]|nr:hypothetical protein [Chitinophagaceae bacterium]
MGKFLEVLQMWLKKNSLDSDSHIYTQEEWRKREEPYHNDADYIITTEGGLFQILNFGDPADYGIQFSDLLESFNYFYELGHSWNLGLYKIEEVAPFSPSNISYSEKLKNPLWQKKRQYVLKRAENNCEDCGKTNVPLDIHHCYYVYGLEPWQYPYDALKALCRDCHNKRGEIERILRANLQSFTYLELSHINGALDTILGNYDRDLFFKFLEAIGQGYRNVEPAFKKFYNSWPQYHQR